MKITPLGAAGGEVTGSCYLVETDRACLMVDCGLFQGSAHAESKNRAPAASRCQELSTVLLTHAHLDHTGRLPLIPKAGYTGPIHATPATIELTGLILRDSAKLQVQDNERTNRKRALRNELPLDPLYTPEDAEKLLKQLQPVPYQQPVVVAPGVQAIWAEAGHMLGSGSIQLIVDEDGRQKRIVFSGDLGPRGAPILKDYEPFRRADLVFLESTYGDRDHKPFLDTVKEFQSIVQDAVKNHGKMLVPTFAVGRAQLLTLLLSQMFRTGKVKPFPIFLDSPMAIEASRIYGGHEELFDEEMIEYLRQNPLQADLHTMKATPSADESKAINDQPGPCLVMAGAGMCNAGRIIHHLRANLWKPEAHVIIVGYQGDGSLGRRLVDGAKEVSIFGEKVEVKAKIHTLNGFSAHAGQTDLLRWLGVIAPCKPRVALTHGENGPRTALAEQIKKRFGIEALLPREDEVIKL